MRPIQNGLFLPAVVDVIVGVVEAIVETVVSVV